MWLFICVDSSFFFFQKNYDIAQNTASARFFDPLWKFKRFCGLGLEGALPKHVKVLDDYIYKVIKDRLENVDDGQQDMLSLYIDYGRKKGKEFDLKFLRDMVLNFVIAGRDTTAAASMWLIYEIAHNPSCLISFLSLSLSLSLFQLLSSSPITSQ